MRLEAYALAPFILRFDAHIAILWNRRLPSFLMSILNFHFYLSISGLGIVVKSAAIHMWIPPKVLHMLENLPYFHSRQCQSTWVALFIQDIERKRLAYIERKRFACI
jgi:hypothetical protein